MSKTSTNNQQKLGGKFHGLTQLKIGEKYTLLKDGFFGAVALKIVLVEIKVEPYAQYTESVQLIFKIKGKRNLRGQRFHGRDSCVVWQGWIDVDTNAFHAPETTESGLTVKRGKYASCDSRFMTDAVASVSVSPIFSEIYEFISGI